MSDHQPIDGVLVQWGERLFYPGNRIVKVAPQPKLPANLLRQRANAVRARIEATVVRRAPQVMVKVSGGGRGMKAVAAHFKYIIKNGRLDTKTTVVRCFEGRTICADLQMTGGLAGRRSTTWGFVGRPSTSCYRCRGGPIPCTS